MSGSGDVLEVLVYPGMLVVTGLAVGALIGQFLFDAAKESGFGTIERAFASAFAREVAGPVTWAELYPDAPQRGPGPYWCHSCGASVDEQQMHHTLVADWCFCRQCWNSLMARMIQDA